MSSKNKQETLLSIEDRARMARLHEEVMGRITEMSMIVARVLDLSSHETMSLQMTPVRDQARKGVHEKLFRFEIVCATDSDGNTVCGCYDHEKGLCFEC